MKIDSKKATNVVKKNTNHFVSSSVYTPETLVLSQEVDVAQVLGRLAASEPLPVLLPSRLYAELGEGLWRVEPLLARVGVSAVEASKRFYDEVGLRQSEWGEREYIGLSIGEYSAERLLSALLPWGESQWEALSSEQPSLWLSYEGQRLPGESLAEQAEYTQLRYGSEHTELALQLCVV